MLKRLWLILGPVFCAMALVATLLFFYPINHKHNLTEEKKAAVSLTAEGFKSRARKEEALGDPNYRFVPFFGSSEWLRFDIVHPAVLAEKYDWDAANSSSTRRENGCLCGIAPVVYEGRL